MPWKGLNVNKMQKRIIALLLVLCLCFCMLLVACKGDEENPGEGGEPTAGAGGSEQKGHKYTNPSDSSSGDVHEPIPEWSDPSWSYNY